MFAVLNVISKKVEDRTLILFGYVCEVVTLAYLMWYLPSATRRKYNTKGTWREQGGHILVRIS